MRKLLFASLARAARSDCSGVSGVGGIAPSLRRASFTAQIDPASITLAPASRRQLCSVRERSPDVLRHAHRHRHGHHDGADLCELRPGGDHAAGHVRRRVPVRRRLRGYRRGPARLGLADLRRCHSRRRQHHGRNRATGGLIGACCEPMQSWRSEVRTVGSRRPSSAARDPTRIQEWCGPGHPTIDSSEARALIRSRFGRTLGHGIGTPVVAVDGRPNAVPGGEGRTTTSCNRLVPGSSSAMAGVAGSCLLDG